MRSNFILPAFLATLVAGAPRPQDIDFDMVLAAPNPTYSDPVGASATAQSVSYNAASILASATADITADPSLAVSVTETAAPTVNERRDIERRAACQSQAPAASKAPVVSPDTDSAFASNTAMSYTASHAAVPTGYVQTFTNLNASNSAYGYLGYTTLQDYDTEACAAKCNKINGCMAINIYYERDPSVIPGPGCTKPSSVTWIKCVFWGGPVNSGNANNYGQYQSDFHVVIAGSNGYVNNTIASPPGYGTAIALGSSAINALYDAQGYYTYMGSTIFSSGPFNASLCAAYCDGTSNYNRAHPPQDGSPVQTCQFFNTYILYINNTGNLQGQYCAMYSETWGSSTATNNGQYRGNDHYMIEYSYAYSNSTDPGTVNKNGAVHQASKDIAWSTLQPFCSSYLGYSAAVTTVTATSVVTPVSTAFSTATVTSIAYAKRALSTPNGLTRYPASVLSSACSLQVSAGAGTSTVTTNVVSTAPAFLTTIVTVTTAVSTSTTTVAKPSGGLINGDFSDVSGAPWQVSNNPYTFVSDDDLPTNSALHGTFARIVVSEGGSSIRLSQTISNVTPATQYTITWTYDVFTSGSTCQVYSAGSNHWTYNYPSSSSSRGSYVSGADGVIEFALDVSCTSTLNDFVELGFDDFVLTLG